MLWWTEEERGPPLRVGVKKDVEVRMAKPVLRHPLFCPKLGRTLMQIRETSNSSTSRLHDSPEIKASVGTVTSAWLPSGTPRQGLLCGQVC